MKWLLFLDLDGTFWDHLDVSSMSLPFRRTADDAIEDSDGNSLKLMDGSLEFVRWVRNKGGIISTCSWNKPEYAMSALETLQMENEFDYHRISTNPRKDLSMLDLIYELESTGTRIREDRIFYLDDRDIHMDHIRENLPRLNFLHMWKKVNGFAEAMEIISRRLGQDSNFSD